VNDPEKKPHLGKNSRQMPGVVGFHGGGVPSPPPPLLVCRVSWGGGGWFVPVSWKKKTRCLEKRGGGGSKVCGGPLRSKVHQRPSPTKRKDAITQERGLGLSKKKKKVPNLSKKNYEY